ncbi:MAG: chemotaxis protein CheA [Candidatus Adiutrix sp.]|jgi:chemotaxis protein histidine kinase CheA|nr:chemotaxis protein CheA [Candidatus Adiutrix sp.]
MAFDLEKVEEQLNAISLDLLMVSTDNLIEISGLLGKLEPLSAAFAPLASELPELILGALKETLKNIIRGRIENAAQAMEQAGLGLSMLQELARSLPVNAPFKADVPAWVAGLAAQATSAGLFPGDEAVPDAYVRMEDKANKLLSGAGYLPETPLSVNRFKKEFPAAVEEMQILLVAIEQKSDPQAALGDLTRNFRAVLGGASLLELEDMAIVSSSSGDLIEYVVAGQVPYSTAVTDILLRSCDYLLKGFRGLTLDDDGRGWHIDAASYDQAEFDSFLDQLWMARQGIMPIAAADSRHIGQAAMHKPKKIGEILIEKGLISEEELGGLIEAQQNARKVPLGDILLAEKFITQQDLDEALEEQRQGSPGKRLGEILVAQGKLDYEQIDIAMKNQELKRETKMGEFLVKAKIGTPEKVALALREQKLSERAGASPTGQAMAQTVKVETPKLDSLIDLVGELVIAQSLINSNSLIASLKEQKLAKDLAHVSRITSELQRNAMSLRMVQIYQTFQRMNRLVRDLSHRFDKDVKFETSGGDTEIDRNMVESIYDPMVHMVRNALDHGVETPEERRAKGKSPQGAVWLKAYHQSGNVVIELTDDGRGLDVKKVLEKAVAQGLVAPGEVLSDAAIHALVFLPGFSTADKISDISGRGVGMDVVKHAIEKLHGKVDFASVPDRGSTLTIRLPLTLAIIDGMIVRVGEHRYILPTISISESFRPAPEDYFTVKNQGEMIKVRRHLLPLMRLDRIVGARGALTNPDEALVVVVENEGDSRCLLVDEVLGKQEVVIKSLGERLKYVRALAGGTILGDGRVGLILDVAGLFEVSGQSGRPLSLGGETTEEDWGMGGDESWPAGA